MVRGDGEPAGVMTDGVGLVSPDFFDARGRVFVYKALLRACMREGARSYTMRFCELLLNK